MSTVRAALCRATEGARACAGFFFVACALLSLAGCISMPQSEALREAPPQDLPRRVDLDKSVPFHLQDDFLCGPATLAMAFNAAGVPATVESLTPMVYLPGRKGSLQPEMLGATRRHGLVAYTPPPQMEAVLRELAAGTPVVVLINLAVKLMPVWHYAVLIGYDLDKREVIVRSGQKPRDTWSFGFLEFFWQDSNYWSMLALPPGRLAATAREQEFSLAVAALEQAGKPAEARASYRALLERWPDNLLALIGLGNTEYAMKNLPGAEQAFRRASVAHPQSAVAFNNLAHVLAGLGKLAEAESAARAAVALEGPTLPEAKKTLDEILARRARS